MAFNDLFEGIVANVCSSIDYGLTASAKAAPGGPKFLRITDIVPGFIDWQSVPYVSTVDADRYRLHENDIVIARTGATTGVSCHIRKPPEAVFASYLVRLVIRPEFDSRFISYWLKTDAFWNYLKGCLGDKSAQPNASASTMTKAPIKIPRSKKEQRRIANVLVSLDDRIDHNRALAANLEAIAHALFKSWFVDFDPVRAKACGISLPGLAPDLAALFPDRLVDSELGEIPEGWRNTCVGQLAELVKGCSYKGDGLSDANGAHMFNLGCFNEKRVFATERIKRYTGDYRERHMVKAGDLIIANTDMTQHREILGRPLLVPEGFEPGFISHHVFKVAMKENFNNQRWRNFLFFALQQDQFRERAVGHATGTTVLALARDSAEKCPVIDPPPSLLAAFAAIVDPVIALVANTIASTEKLIQLRNLLLPRLISGKLRVEDAAVELEAA